MSALRATPNLSRSVAISLGCAAIGVVGLVWGALTDPMRALFSYLVGYNYVVTIVLGALVFLMIGHTMGAGWPVLLRRLTEAIVGTLPLLLLLFLPILIGAKRIYPWYAQRSPGHASSAATHYLTPNGFVARSLLYFAVWIVVGVALLRWSLAEDATPQGSRQRRMRALSSVMLPGVALTLSFASIDWLMSLTFPWFSSMYPIYYFAGGFVGALALLTVLTFAADRAHIIGGVGAAHYYALGRLLLAFVVFWAYAAFFQLLLIWIANKPDDVPFYVDRVRGGFRTVTIALAIVHFVVPFLVLLNYRIKRLRRPLAIVAAWILAAHYLDVHWLVIPSVRPNGPIFTICDGGALLALVGGVSAFGLLLFRRWNPVPLNDPALARALRYDSR